MTTETAGRAVIEPRTVSAPDSGPLLPRVGALAGNLPQRVRERPFWVIQAWVFGITAAHIVTEFWAGPVVDGVHPTFHHIPVVLYLAPIGYASLRYGTEGAVLTGLWCAALTSPNIAWLHRTNFEWLTELVYVGIVVVVGVVMAVPVERERLQRQRAEATSRRLALLNEIAALTLTAAPRRALDETLAKLRAVLDLEAACVVVADPDEADEDGTRLSVLACQPPESAGAALAACLQERHLPTEAAEPMPVGDGAVAVTLAADLLESDPTGGVSGLLAAKSHPERPLGDRDRQLLTAVGSQLAIALASARLQERERHRLRSYAQLVMRAQEDERRRIARELHDEAAQNLVAIRRHLDALAASPSIAAAEEELIRLRELVGRTLAGLRRFSRDLRPPVLDDLGLVSALEALVADVRPRGDPAVELRVTGTSRRLPTETELALFRIGQAALHNMERHAHASHGCVELTFEPQRVQLVVSDDGCGFELPEDLEDLTRTGKLGLVGMTERAELVGGTLEVHSAPGAGTRICVGVPG